MIALAVHAAAQQDPFVERVEVARVLIDARAFDTDGRPIPDLRADDFAVEIDGRSVRVESAEWIGSDPVAAPGPATQDAASGPPAEPRRRLVVFLVQKSLEPLRILGLMHVGQLVDALLQPLTRDDRVAVVSFDSRLRLWADFTNDLDRVRSILAHDVITQRPPAVTAAGDVSLIARLDRESDARIFSIEQALRRIGESLEPLPGAKSVILLGYGFGRFNARTGSIVLMDGYQEASAALQRARASVFTLNVTRATHNSLQAGLETVSEQTGGLYASTYEFPQRAIEQLGRALAGHYVLFVEKPPALERGVHRIEVRLRNRRGTVTARRSYAD